MSNLDSFRALGISECVLAALQKKGFEEPSPIQKLTIPLLLTGEKDMIGQAQTGTGKTAAFGIPIIDTIPGGGKAPQALILSPTRELSIQIADELNSLRGESPLKIAPFFGGQFIGIQLKKLESGIDIVIGTPGRILDLLRRGKLHFDALQFVVLDEADEMLDMGFIDDIRDILSQTPPEKRMLLFSATMPAEILKIAGDFMREGFEIVRTQEQNLTPVELTDQSCYIVRRDQKVEALSRLIDMERDPYAMIFCRTRTDVDDLTERLNLRGYKVEALHGDIAQAQRLRVISAFKARQFKLLVATDVAARGIDVNDLSCVINYSMPESPEIYVHRIGRTGRAGKRGRAITLVTPFEQRRFKRMLRILKLKVGKKELPTVAEFLEVRKQAFVEQLCDMIDKRDHESYLSFAEELLTLSDHPAELVAALLKLRFNKTLLPESYTELTNVPDDPQKEAEPGSAKEIRLRFATGRAMGVSVPEILLMISDRTGIRARQMGRIDCHDDFTYINVNDEAAKILLEAFRDTPLQAVEVPPEEGAPAAALMKKKKRKSFRKGEGFPRRFGHPAREHARRKPEEKERI